MQIRGEYRVIITVIADNKEDAKEQAYQLLRDGGEPDEVEFVQAVQE